jgi:hypothetical protein
MPDRRTLNLENVWNESFQETPGGLFKVILHGRTSRDTRYTVNFTLDPSAMGCVAQQAMKAMADQRDEIDNRMDRVRRIQ